MTAMGIRFNSAASTIGILLPVTVQDLKAFDGREQGYDRIELRLADIDKVPFLKEKHYEQQDHETFLNAKEQNARHAVKIWVYIQKENLFPTQHHPIVQSYVDTILRGCLNVGGEDFAREFIRSTKGWHPQDFDDSSSDNGSSDDSDYDEDNEDDDSLDTSTTTTTTPVIWVNDRCTPVYQRGDPAYMQEHAKTLDSLFLKDYPKYLSSRKTLESGAVHTVPVVGSPKVRQ